MTRTAAIRPIAMLATFLLGSAALACHAACPADPSAPAETVLSLRVGAKPAVRLDLRAVVALGERQLTPRRSVAVAAASAVATEQSVVYGGVPLGTIVAAAGGDDLQRRDQRGWAFEAIATDGYRAVFSWGELFNSDGTEQILVITAQDGCPLDAYEGPLALRALADRRPGPRHVRNLCAIVGRALPPADR